jgi:hypothetical protein
MAMPETKEDIAAERDRLAAENEQLKSQLAAVGAGTAGRAAVPEHTFLLSEADRQELEQRGWINYRGRVMTTADVREELGPKSKVPIADAPASAPKPPVLAVREGVPGVDFVYPSVAPGQIDPAVAGTPGISGPAAEKTEG